MRRFFRSVDLTALVAITLIAAPLSNRLAAQDFQPTNTDSIVLTHDSRAASDSVGSNLDLRAVPQQAAAPTAEATVARPVGASKVSLRSAVHARENVGPLVVNAAAQRANIGQSQALMVVGGAALIVGAIIGDDPGTIIMVGGAVIGLYGLYQYLQ